MLRRAPSRPAKLPRMPRALPAWRRRRRGAGPAPDRQAAVAIRAGVGGARPRSPADRGPPSTSPTGWVWHRRFAAAYASTFGERPSVTPPPARWRRPGSAQWLARRSPRLVGRAFPRSRAARLEPLYFCRAGTHCLGSRPMVVPRRPRRGAAGRESRDAAFSHHQTPRSVILQFHTRAQPALRSNVSPQSR